MKTVQMAAAEIAERTARFDALQPMSTIVVRRERVQQIPTATAEYPAVQDFARKAFASSKRRIACSTE